MSKQDWPETLRCPLDPNNGRLKLASGYLECERCALRFKIEDGFPRMVVEDAELPVGCASIAQLPCQGEQKQAGDGVPSR